MAPIIDFADGHSGKEVVQRVTCGACRIGILGQAIFSRSGGDHENHARPVRGEASCAGLTRAAMRPQRSMDCRVEPGNDELWSHAAAARLRTLSSSDARMR